MPVSLVYLTPTNLNIQRQWYVAVSHLWWNNHLVTYGQTMVWEDIGFGGYQFRLKFTDSFWNMRANFYTVDYIVDSVGYYAPDGSLDPYTANIQVLWQWQPDAAIPRIQFRNNAIPGGYQCDTVVALPTPNTYKSDAYPVLPTLPQSYHY